MSGKSAKRTGPAGSTSAPANASAEIIYERSPLKLVRRPDRTNLEIIWREPGKDSPNKRTAGTDNEHLGKLALDALFRDMFGGCEICPTCGQGVNKANQPITRIIDDYWAVHCEQLANPRSVRDKLTLVRHFLGHIGGQTRADQVDEKWIKRLRAYLLETPYYHADRYLNSPYWDGKKKPKRGKPLYRKPSTVEGAVSALHAALKWSDIRPQFTPIDMRDLSEPPSFRLTVEQLAEAFRWSLADPRRLNLRNFLRLSIASWARPEAVMELDLTPGLKQWDSESQTLRLNPVGRAKTRKRRPTVPVPPLVGVWLDTLPKEAVFETRLTNTCWDRMAIHFGWPRGGLERGESGMKLIRRSIAQLARDRLGEESWVQGQMMLGHVGFNMSDRYALRKANHLGKALAVTEAIVAEIEALCPGAFIDANGGQEWVIARAAKTKKRLALRIGEAPAAEPGAAASGN